ncbi:MAG: SGNH/GDSL hydrolase family protein, partial [Nitrospiraceae bacterium]
SPFSPLTRRKYRVKGQGARFPCGRRFRAHMRTLFRVLGALALVFLMSLLVLEALYRWQVVDTYLPELRAFNPPQSLSENQRPTILVMGDSFTAGPMNYPALLQQAFTHVRIVNAGVSGTGVIQTAVMAPKRFRDFHPSIFLYQLYVGNDLFDVNYPVNWDRISFVRNLYWMIANHLRAVGYVNYRIGQARQSDAGGPPAPGAAPGTGAVPATDSFSTERYEGRVKIYLRADPSLLENSILVKGRRRDDYITLLAKLEEVVAYCEPQQCEVYLLVIPHVCQVDERYVFYMQQLGASFTEPDRLRATGYPFIQGMQDRFRKSPHVHVLNPLQALREANHQAPVYFTNDEHLNLAGHKAIADFLATQLNLE